MVVDRAIGRRAGPVVEVARPAFQQAVQLAANIGPGLVVAPVEDCTEPRLETGPRFIANHRRSSPSSEACRKSGPFPPPALPGLDGRMNLSDSRRAATRCGVRGGKPRPTRPPPITRIALPACYAHYPGGPERVHWPVPSPFRAAFPATQARRRPHREFRGLLGLYSLRPTGSLSRPWRPLSQGFSPLLSKPPVSYSINRLTIEVESSSTGNTRLRGALGKIAQQQNAFCRGTASDFAHPTSRQSCNPVFRDRR